MDNEIPSRSLTIYLAKENRKPSSLIRTTEGLTEKEIPVGGRTLGRLYIKLPDAKPPSWADFFEEYVKLKSLAKSAWLRQCFWFLYSKGGPPSLSDKAGIFFGQMLSKTGLV
jgi:hypothetical protein